MGAVASTTISSVLSSSETVNIVPSANTLSLPDGVTIVWLDPRANANSNHGYNTKLMLQKIHSSVFTFDDINNCRDFLGTINNTKSRVFLISSGKFSTLILPDLARLSAIDSVFIFCAHPTKYAYLITEYSPHVIDIFDRQEKLQLCLETELNKYHARAPAFNFFAQKQNAVRDLTHDAASFIWFQLLQRVLMNTKYDKNDMEQMLRYCREHYKRHPEQQRYVAEIDKFATMYSPEKAITWYTRQSFVYKLINTALRTEDVEGLYIFRFYISDLCRQLANAQTKFRIENQKSPILKLYRGCHMTPEELNKLQDTIGGLTSLNGFVSTSMEPMVADVFLSRDSHRGSNIQKVLWIIEADIRSNDIIFANIEPFSEHPEAEVLFNIGSAFRIDNVTLDKKTKIWHVQATATNAGTYAASEYMALIKAELEETSEKVVFGTLFMDMGKHITAQHYFEDLIQHTDRNHPDLAAFHYNLGLTYSFQGDLDLAEQHFHESLEYQNLKSTKPRNIVRTLNAIGWVHRDSGDMDKAIKFYREADSICTEKLGSDDIANAQTYTYMGRYHSEREKYTESNICYARALKILRLRLPEKHQRLGIILNEMGDVERKQSKSKQALELYQRAEAIFNEILPRHHPCMAYCWSMMGLVFLQLGNIEEAQRYHRKALDSYKRVLLPNHKNISISEKNSTCNDYDRIVDSYSQVCSQV